MQQAEMIPITVAYGDGIGPEIMQATLRILEAAGARIQPETIEVGEAIYLQGHTSGIRPEAWGVLRRNKIFLKAPLTTPVGEGYKSLNVTIRKTMGLYANVRPCVSYAPFVNGPPKPMSVVIIRENEEDLYAGVEHQQTPEVVQCLKLISRPGCERIIRYAFEYARKNQRKRITCMIKDNIMKMTDGLFYRVFQEIGKQYPEIEQERMIIDIGAARLATRPDQFDVVVAPNLYGDILSDIAAEVAGSVGLAGSANIGEHIAMFEAVHGSAPDIAGKGLANPSGLLQSAVMMLVHIGQADVAERVQNAWLCTLEKGQLTADMSPEASNALSTETFTEAVIANLGELPKTFPRASFKTVTESISTQPAEDLQAHNTKETVCSKTLVGVDVFIQANPRSGAADRLATQLQEALGNYLPLQLITNRGVKVWPHGQPETFCTDHWRCRFVLPTTAPADGMDFRKIIDLMYSLAQRGLDVIKIENLYLINGKQAYSAAQGE